MNRRTLLSAAALSAAAFGAASQARAQDSDSGDMHPPQYKALEEASGHCVSTANDCLRHCFGMMSMHDTSMSGCAASAYQVVVACGALQALAAVNAAQVPAMAKAVAEICSACQEQCEKFPKIAECRACGDSCKACAAECRKIAA